MPEWLTRTRPSPADIAPSTATAALVTDEALHGLVGDLWSGHAPAESFGLWALVAVAPGKLRPVPIDADGHAHPLAALMLHWLHPCAAGVAVALRTTLDTILGPVDQTTALAVTRDGRSVAWHRRGSRSQVDVGPVGRLPVAARRAADVAMTSGVPAEMFLARLWVAAVNAQARSLGDHPRLVAICDPAAELVSVVQPALQWAGVTAEWDPTARDWWDERGAVVVRDAPAETLAAVAGTAWSGLTITELEWLGPQATVAWTAGVLPDVFTGLADLAERHPHCAATLRALLIGRGWTAGA